MEMNLFAIDPGTRTTGWALFKNGNISSHGIIKGKSSKWIENTNQIMAGLLLVCGSKSIEKIIIELPEYWQGPEGLAARESGSVDKIYFLCGRMYEYFKFEARASSSVIFVRPSQWKAQLPKKVMQKRILKNYPELKDIKSDDEWDAIGIGLWALEQN